MYFLVGDPGLDTERCNHQSVLEITNSMYLVVVLFMGNLKLSEEC